MTMWILMLCIGASANQCEQSQYGIYPTEQACLADLSKLSSTGAYNLTCMADRYELLTPGDEIIKGDKYD